MEEKHNETKLFSGHRRSLIWKQCFVSLNTKQGKLQCNRMSSI